MIKQPELGRKIAALRKEKGLTQEELVNKCNLNVRTLQRIESGAVNPRNYTVKEIMKALECDFSILSDENKDFQSGSDKKSLIRFFNFKKSTMRKLSVLSISCLIVVFAISTWNSRSNAQKSQNNKYTTLGCRGIVYMLPQSGSSIYVSCTNNEKDTAVHSIEKYTIKEFGNKIYLNSRFVGEVYAGDTVVLNKGKIEIRKLGYWEYLSSNGNGIIYKIPNRLRIVSINNDSKVETLMFDNEMYIREADYEIYWHDDYIGKVNRGDTIWINNSTTVIPYLQSKR